LNTEPGELGVLLTIDPGGDPLAYPTPDDGLYVMLIDDGTFRTYDSTGSVTFELATGVVNMLTAAGDEASGRLAFGSPFPIGPDATGAVVIDPASGDFHVVPDVGSVARLSFARNGELLAVMSTDGTVRLWDVERQDFGGVIWDGTGAGPDSPLWYDESTDALWVSSSGRLLLLPLSPQRWVERACELVGRDFTQDEWDRFVPGDELLQSSCV
jgi:WD40 repeat protein